MLTKRRFLLGITAGFAAPLVMSGGLPRAFAAGPAPSGESDSVAGSFQARLKEWFYFSSADARHQGQAQLVAVNELAPQPGLEQFELVFRTAVETHLPADTYMAQGDLGGRFPIYIEAGAVHGRRRYHRAHFSLLQ